MFHTAASFCKNPLHRSERFLEWNGTRTIEGPDFYFLTGKYQNRSIQNNVWFQKTCPFHSFSFCLTSVVFPFWCRNKYPTQMASVQCEGSGLYPTVWSLWSKWWSPWSALEVQQRWKGETWTAGKKTQHGHRTSWPTHTILNFRNLFSILFCGWSWTVKFRATNTTQFSYRL